VYVASVATIQINNCSSMPVICCKFEL